MKLNTTIEAIRKRCPSFNNRVFAFTGPMQFQNLRPEKLPAAYVTMVGEVAEVEQMTANSYLQNITSTVGVLIVVNSQEDRRGQNAFDKAEDLKNEILKALLSWSPIPDDNMAIYSYQKYSVLKVEEPVLAVQIDLQCTYEISSKDTRQPDELEETTGKFNELNATVSDEFKGGIDVIGQGDKPDGQIDAQFKFKDLW